MKAALCPSGWGREMKLLHSRVPRDHTRGRSLSLENHYVGLIELSFNPTSFFLLASPRRLILHYSTVPCPPLTPYLLPHTKGEPKRLLVSPPVAERILTHPLTSDLMWIHVSYLLPLSKSGSSSSSNSRHRFNVGDTCELSPSLGHSLEA